MIDTSFSKEAMRKLMGEEAHYRPSFADIEDEDFQCWLNIGLWEYQPRWCKRIKEEDNELVEMESGWAEHHLESFDTKQNLAAYVRALRSCWGFSYEDRLKPHIPVATDRVLPLSLASSYKGMRLVTLQSKEKAARLKSLRAMNKTVENMRTKIGMKNNVIRKLPKNCPY
ncbi:cytoplasmic 60S subunit biogenesis factor REI1 homolog 1 [Oryza sativa Japonica Group]|jgi:hypothetical protein|uniref:cytoplasmic 60S subunit biogenesis factor REI1 homolog 1 n=1 Tax=Oryza sativa subsp. japonica TaxID=39947 RepID=UPI0007755712|nr:cytoplasmic 60S subunit biogenesis factor REI1 homolog 1 [Oryza sativa Japonica Group]XP_052158879.1 cytoplasmic 60S subunit biogenesis factor REI1 homolog 1-like isoform X1 [Oryza glaberrima]KAF2928244.1 hypothetical protein DAI22_06g264200 [Oryza sativa Japonica Group]KAF2928246.1 hypothetical protein DAI22_06g264200 [Oryza sativa Japonica Group]KAF2928248.1 hypothetical protein DAI22_06g264200 [Oryza sativa Japonica Group]